MKRTFGEKTLRMTAMVLTVTGALMMAMGLFATAQEAAKPQAAPTATPAATPKIEEPAAKPIIVTKTQVLTSENLLLKLQNAQLAAAAAVPPDLKKAIEDAEKALTEFYAKEIGIPRDQLSGYDITPGVGGDLILRKKAAAVAPAGGKQ